MSEKIIDYKSQKEFRIFAASTFTDLKTYHSEGQKTAFNSLLLKLMPEIKRYIADRLNTALVKGNLPEGKYGVDDFLDQLIIEVNDHFEEVKTKEDLYPWLFKKADELLEDTIVDEEFDEYFFENIDNFVKPEWDEMEEKFSIDGDGDLVMIDELDDISYPNNKCVLNHVFVAVDNNELIEKLDKEWGGENIKKHAALVLHNLPIPMRAVFKLATQYQFTLEEIAVIRNQSFEEVRQLLESARKSLETSFLNRYAL